MVEENVGRQESREKIGIIGAAVGEALRSLERNPKVGQIVIDAQTFCGLTDCQFPPWASQEWKPTVEAVRGKYQGTSSWESFCLIVEMIRLIENNLRGINNV